MEVAPTFGAVGDIISIVVLITEIPAALDECRGSDKAYRDLVDELNLLHDSRGDASSFFGILIDSGLQSMLTYLTPQVDIFTMSRPAMRYVTFGSHHAPRR